MGEWVFPRACNPLPSAINDCGHAVRRQILYLLRHWRGHDLCDCGTARPLGLFVNLSLAFSAACFWIIIGRRLFNKPDGADGASTMGITEPLTVEQINQQMGQLAREIVSAKDVIRDGR